VVIVLGWAGSGCTGRSGPESLLAGDRGDAIAALVVVFGGLFILLLAFVNVSSVLLPAVSRARSRPADGRAHPALRRLRVKWCVQPRRRPAAIPIGIALAWFGWRAMPVGVLRPVGAAAAGGVVFVTSTVMGAVLLITRAIPAAGSARGSR